MSAVQPLHSFIGGLGLSLPVHSLLLLNGRIFGISGFLHRSVRGSKESIASAAGLLIGGVLIGLIEKSVPQPCPVSFPSLVLSGLLVGAGTKLSNGCTSGHMLAGISRLSVRSVVSTAVFFSIGAITAQYLHWNLPPTPDLLDWTLRAPGRTLLVAQVFPLLVSTVLFLATPPATSELADNDTTLSRLVASVATGLEFALALKLSNLTEPLRVLAFLLLPYHQSFDPSLAFLAAGALPSGIALYQLCRGPERPKLGGKWAVPGAGRVDMRLIIGSVIFGLGWGLAGICPGPAVVNLGRSLAMGADPVPMLVWLFAMVLGGISL